LEGDKEMITGINEKVWKGIKGERVEEGII
jgi:hypothetical protein